MIKIVVGLIVFGMIAGTQNVRASELEQKWGTFLENVVRLSEIEQTLQEAAGEEDSVQQEAERALKEVSEMHMEVGEAFLKLYLGRLSTLAGNPKESLFHLKEALKDPATAPEAMKTLKRSMRGKGSKIDLTVLRGRFENVDTFHSEVFAPRGYHSGKILPLSRAGKRIDAEIIEERKWDGSAPIGLDPWSAYPHGFSSVRIHERIIDSFLAMNMTEWLELACLEKIYYAYEPVRLTSARIGINTWLSPRVAYLWAKAAEQAWIQSKVDDAAVYAAKAYVFGDDESREIVRELISRWQTEPPPDEPPQPHPAAQLPEELKRRFRRWRWPTEPLENVIQVYRNVRLYPRCLELLDEYGKEALGEERTNELREEIEEKFFEDPRQIVIWGQEASTREDREKITVPRIASEEARREAVEWLEGIIELLEETQTKENEDSEE